jgi:WD40 repeat protein
VSAAVVVVVAALLVIAVALRGQSNSRQQVSRSQELAKQATDALLNGRLDASILLGLEAARRARTVEALSSVIRGLESIPPGMLAYRVLPSAGFRVVYSPDGHTLGFASGAIWNTRTGRLTQVPIAGNASGGVAFSPDGAAIAIGNDRGEVTMWDVRTSRLLRTFATHSDFISDVAFSPDGGMLPAATSTGSIPRWDRRSGRSIGGLLKANSQVNAIAFTHDGKLLAAGTDAGGLTVIDAVSGRTVSRASLRDSILQVAFAHDDRTLAAATWGECT